MLSDFYSIIWNILEAACFQDTVHQNPSDLYNTCAKKCLYCNHL